MAHEKKQSHFFYNLFSKLFFLDVIFNRHTRPIMIYTGLIIAVGAALYHWLEGWSWLDSVYFVVITLTTIGYGDLHPTMPVTKVITIFYGINGIVLILVLFDVIRNVRGMEMKGAVKNVKDQHQ